MIGLIKEDTPKRGLGIKLQSPAAASFNLESEDEMIIDGAPQQRRPKTARATVGHSKIDVAIKQEYRAVSRQSGGITWPSQTSPDARRPEPPVED